MARSLNKVQLIGNLGADPEVRNLENDLVVANIRIATTESYTDKNSGQRVDKTEWHRIVLWRGLAKVAEQYLHKGDSVYIEGKLRTRTYEKEGQTHYATDIYAENLIMLGGAKGGGTSTQSPTTGTSVTSNNQQNTTVKENTPSKEGYTDISNMDADDDLPF